MEKIQIRMSFRKQAGLGIREIKPYLYQNGLDIFKTFTTIAVEGGLYYYFSGIARPNRVVGILKTCIGLIPITEPWPRTIL